MSMKFISRFTIYMNCEVCEWQFSLFFGILGEKIALFAWFHVKSLKFQELGMNLISQFRIEMKNVISWNAKKISFQCDWLIVHHNLIDINK